MTFILIGISQKGDEFMTENMLAAALIDEYTRLQRIKAAQDREEEIAYQIKTTKAKLDVLGVATEGLDR